MDTRQSSVPDPDRALPLEMDALENFTNKQRGQLRTVIRCLVEEQLPLAHQVVLGEARWSPIQARIFLLLLAKGVGEAAYEADAGLRPVDHPPIISRQALESLANRIAGAQGSSSTF